MLAAAAIVAIPLAISTFVSVLLVFNEETYSAAITGALGIVIGAIAFTSLFAFVGTLTTRAVVFGIVYVFGFEALISSAIPGLKYVSISGNTLSIFQELNSNPDRRTHIRLEPTTTHRIRHHRPTNRHHHLQHRHSLAPKTDGRALNRSSLSSDA